VRDDRRVGADGEDGESQKQNDTMSDDSDSPAAFEDTKTNLYKRPVLNPSVVFTN
jgi:hypothetical protein